MRGASRRSVSGKLSAFSGLSLRPRAGARSIRPDAGQGGVAGHEALHERARPHPRAGMHDHAGGLVDRQQRLVLVQHGEFARRHRRFGRALGDAHRRDAHLVAVGQPRVGRRAAPVHAHFARTDDAVDKRLRHALQVADKEVVEPLPGAGLVDAQMAHRGFGARPGLRRRCPRGAAGRRPGAGSAPYNAPVHDRRPKCLIRRSLAGTLRGARRWRAGAAGGARTR